jgi:hypothetical protein
MSSSKSFSAGGAIRDIASFGFHAKDLPPEGFDNSKDAGATKIKMIIEKDKKCYFVDNASGMTRKQLQDRFTLFKDKEASDSSQGRFGIGENVKHSLLTGNEKKSISISRCMSLSEENPREPPAPHLIEIELNWPHAADRETDEFILYAHSASATSEAIWKKYAINPEGTGTIDVIPLCDNMFKYFTEQVKDFVPHYERMYAKDLRNGLSIDIEVLGELHTLKGHNSLVEDGNDGDTFKDSEQLDIWKRSDGDLRIYFKNSEQKFVYKEPNSNKYNKQHPPKADEGYTHIGTVLVEFAYNPRWRKMYDLGGIYYVRNSKMIDRRAVPEPKGGDFWEQDIIKSCRTCVSFSVKCDELFGIEINKSRIKNVGEKLQKTLQDYAHSFAKSVYKKCKPSVPVGPAPLPSVTPSPANPVVVPPPPTNTLDGILQITTKPKPALVVPPVPAPAEPAPRLLSHPEFMKKYLNELKQAHPDWLQPKRLSSAAELWNTYKATGVLPVLASPSTPIAPPPPPAPTTNIAFSKNPADSTLTITEGSTVLFTLHYVGQAHVWEITLKQILDSVGPARFKEYVAQLVLLNTNYLK